MEERLRQESPKIFSRIHKIPPYGALAVRMLNWMRQRFCSDLAIDLGTTSTQIGLPGEGIRLDEPSVVAVPAGSRQVCRQGERPLVSWLIKCWAELPKVISAVRPLRHGVISDFELTEAMLRYFIRKAARQKNGDEASSRHRGSWRNYGLLKNELCSIAASELEPGRFG